MHPSISIVLSESFNVSKFNLRRDLELDDAQSLAAEAGHVHAHSHGQTPSEVYSDLFSRRDRALFHTKVDEFAPHVQNVNLRTDLELTDAQRLADKAGRVRAHLDGQTPLEVFSDFFGRDQAPFRAKVDEFI
jgi:hypothetical protein